MLHIVKLIERRFPKQRKRIVALLLTLSMAALAVGSGIMLLGK